MTDVSPEPKGTDAELESRVQAVFEASINPALQSHGGFVRLVKVEDGNVQVELGGGCRGCPGARMTMKQGIEAFLRESIPEIGQVLDVTDHGS
ncbi:MAG: NifU family protein [Kiritimatiellia bacterium]|nr:NifU family protein [Kiritimatiellia bacterium]